MRNMNLFKSFFIALTMLVMALPLWAQPGDGLIKQDLLTNEETNIEDSLQANGEIGTKAGVTMVQVDPTYVNLSVGETATLRAYVYPSSATNQNVTWRTSNSSVASISYSRKICYVTAKNGGTAIITVTTEDGGFEATCEVIVRSNTISVNEVRVTPSSVDLKVDETSILTATVYPTNATNQNVTWRTSNSSVAAITWSGKTCTVIGKKEGSATITAETEDGGFEAACNVTVTKTIPVTFVSVNPTRAEVNVGKTIKLTATVYPDNATNQNVTWTSSRPWNASVDKYGNVTGVAQGIATITVTTEDGGYEASCFVEVKPSTTSVNGVTVNPSFVDLEVGKHQTLTATIYPSEATNQNVAWKTNNSSVASISPSGKTCTVTAESEGSAIITVKTSDGGYTATCYVTVTSGSGSGSVLVTDIFVSPPLMNLKVGDTKTITAIVYPSSATNKTVFWKSSSTSVATVDQNGKVTAKAVGTANITATTTDGSNLSATCVLTVTQQGGGGSGSCPSTLMLSALDGDQPADNVGVELMLVNSSLNLNGFNIQIKKDVGSENIQWKQISRKYFSAYGYGHVILARLEDATDEERDELLNEFCDVLSNVKSDELVIVELLKTNDCRFFPVLDTPTGIGKFYLNMATCANGIYRIYAPATPTGCSFSYTGGPEGTVSWTTDEPVEIQLSKNGNIVSAPVIGISVVGIDKNVTGIKYYNQQGIESDTPFPGINIKVTTYSDGTKTIKKILSKQ